LHGSELWSLQVRDLALAGDMDIDGDVDMDDLDDFVLALNSASEYEAIFGVPASLHGDLDRDGDLDFDDIDEFALALDVGSPVQVTSAAQTDVYQRTKRT
jgi:hypothetical protein